MNMVTKCRFTLQRILLCKWGMNMRGNCWLRCHVYTISEPLIKKYIYMYATQANHQSTESPQNIQTHTVHSNTHTSQPIENPILPRQLIHPNHSVYWNTLIKSPSPVKHPSVAPPFRILFNETNYIQQFTPSTTIKKQQHMLIRKNTTKINGHQRGSLAGCHPRTHLHCFLFSLCTI